MKNDDVKARVIAYYLPQFHPIKENDEFWGKGFTEWTNVAKAKPQYYGHYQPQIPADLGFYDLRLPEVRQAQADMARDCGVEGFMYWYYWFGNGRKVLETPINEVMRTGKPDFPFCLGWANHDWSNSTWQKTKKFQKNVTFIKQEYLGEEDYKKFFYDVLPMFKDKRYITVDGKPLFYIFAPRFIPDNKSFIELWNRLANENGLAGIYFIARVDPVDDVKVVNERGYLDQGRKRYDEHIAMGYNAISSNSFRRAEILSDGFMFKVVTALKRRLKMKALNKHDYERMNNHYYMPEDKLEYVYPQITPRKDKTPRAGERALIYSDSTPEKFRKAVKMALECIKEKQNEHKILFLNSWNEWGEGSYMEPDIVFGHQYLDVLKEEIKVK